MTVIFMVDGGERVRIVRANAAPLPGHEVWIGRERYYVSDVPRWIVQEPEGIDPHGRLDVEVELTRLALREDPK